MIYIDVYLYDTHITYVHISTYFHIYICRNLIYITYIYTCSVAQNKSVGVCCLQCCTSFFSSFTGVIFTLLGERFIWQIGCLRNKPPRLCLRVPHCSPEAESNGLKTIRTETRTFLLLLPCLRDLSFAFFRHLSVCVLRLRKASIEYEFIIHSMESHIDNLCCTNDNWYHKSRCPSEKQVGQPAKGGWFVSNFL